MKVKKLGIEWGAAFEEAQPIKITSMNGEDSIIVYEREGYGLTIDLGHVSFNVSAGKDGITIDVNK